MRQLSRSAGIKIKQVKAGSRKLRDHLTVLHRQAIRSTPERRTSTQERVGYAFREAASESRRSDRILESDRLQRCEKKRRWGQRRRSNLEGRGQERRRQLLSPLFRVNRGRRNDEAATRWRPGRNPNFSGFSSHAMTIISSFFDSNSLDVLSSIITYV